jgi:hypothetical protein
VNPAGHERHGKSHDQKPKGKGKAKGHDRD